MGGGFDGMAAADVFRSNTGLVDSVRRAARRRILRPVSSHRRANGRRGFQHARRGPGRTEHYRISVCAWAILLRTPILLPAELGYRSHL